MRLFCTVLRATVGVGVDVFLAAWVSCCCSLMFGMEYSYTLVAWNCLWFVVPRRCAVLHKRYVWCVWLAAAVSRAASVSAKMHMRPHCLFSGCSIRRIIHLKCPCLDLCRSKCRHRSALPCRNAAGFICIDCASARRHSAARKCSYVMTAVQPVVCSVLGTVSERTA
jgi:hypothetical protein